MKYLAFLLVGFLLVPYALAQEGENNQQASITLSYAGTQSYYKESTRSESFPLGIAATLNIPIAQSTGLAIQGSYLQKSFDDFEDLGIDLVGRAFGILGGFSGRGSIFWGMTLLGAEISRAKATSELLRASESEQETGFVIHTEVGITYPQGEPWGITMSTAYRNSFYDDGQGSHDLRYTIGVTLGL